MSDMSLPGPRALSDATHCVRDGANGHSDIAPTPFKSQTNKGSQQLKCVLSANWNNTVPGQFYAFY